MAAIVLYFNEKTVAAWAGDNYQSSRVYHNSLLEIV